MSHSSGIIVSETLKQQFAEGNFRALFVSIVDNTYLDIFKCVSLSSEDDQHWSDKDYEVITDTITSTNEPCFVLFKLDLNNYLLISYIPDEAQVRLKMLYSSTKATLTKQLGDSLFTDAFHANHLSELTLKEYKSHVQMKTTKDNLPLTDREIEINRIKKEELNSSISVSSKQSFNNGIQLAISNIELLQEFKKDSNNHLLFKIQLDFESFTIEKFESITRLIDNMPRDSPSFSLVNNVAGDETKTVKTLFLYLCPGDSRVKERMLYSASRANLLSIISKYCEVEVKCETSDVTEITKTWLDEECGVSSTSTNSSANSKQVSSSNNTGFIRKGLSGPGSGGRRLIRPQ